jgi:hypothetical protein
MDSYFSTNDFSISFFYDTNSSSDNYKVIFAKRDVCNHSSFMDILSKKDGIGYELDDGLGNYTVNQSPKPSGMTFITMSRKGNAVLFYVNGNLINTDTVNKDTGVTNLVANVTNSAPFGIGVSSCIDMNIAERFNGTIDEIRFYNRALSEAEIKSLYAGVDGISGNINGVQKYSAVCKNTKTSVTKKIAVADGAKEWNCKTAGLQTKKGDIVTVTITGISQ